MIAELRRLAGYPDLSYAAARRLGDAEIELGSTRIFPRPLRPKTEIRSLPNRPAVKVD